MGKKDYKKEDNKKEDNEKKIVFFSFKDKNKNEEEQGVEVRDIVLHERIGTIIAKDIDGDWLYTQEVKNGVLTIREINTKNVKMYKFSGHVVGNKKKLIEDKTFNDSKKLNDYIKDKIGTLKTFNAIRMKLYEQQVSESKKGEQIINNKLAKQSNQKEELVKE